MLENNPQSLLVDIVSLSKVNNWKHLNWGQNLTLNLKKLNSRADAKHTINFRRP